MCGGHAITVLAFLVVPRDIRVPLHPWLLFMVALDAFDALDALGALGLHSSGGSFLRWMFHRRHREVALPSHVVLLLRVAAPFVRLVSLIRWPLGLPPNHFAAESRQKLLEESTTRLNKATHAYLESLRKSCDAAKELATTLAFFADLPDDDTLDGAVEASRGGETGEVPPNPLRAASVGEGLRSLVTVISGLRKTVVRAVEDALSDALLARVSGLMREFPKLKSLLNERDDALTDFDAYTRKVRHSNPGG